MTVLYDAFNVRFANWLAWCRMGGFHQRHAGSIEGRYRSPQHWDPINPKPDWLLSMDENDAVLLNRAYIQSPQRARWVIKVLWLRSWPDAQKAHKIGCRLAELHDVGLRAQEAMRNTLANIERSLKIDCRSKTIRPTGKNRPSRLRGGFFFFWERELIFNIGDVVVTPSRRLAKIVAGNAVEGFELRYEEGGDDVTLMPAHLRLYRIAGSMSERVGQSDARAGGHKRRGRPRKLAQPLAA